MNDHNSPEDLRQLRDRIAELEAARDKPVKVEIEGLEGLKQWSNAIETRQLNRFYAVNSQPDMTNKELLRVALICGGIAGTLYVFAVIRYLSDWPILGF